MPKGPIPPEFQPFVRAARPAVIGTVRPDGAPSTTATWYDWEDGRLMLSMVASGLRARNLRANPWLSLTILGDSWYDHVSVAGRVVEFRADDELRDIDRLSERYTGEPYPKRHLTCVTALVEPERWHSWGDPGVATHANGAG